MGQYLDVQLVLSQPWGAVATIYSLFERLVVEPRFLASIGIGAASRRCCRTGNAGQPPPRAASLSSSMPRRRPGP